MATAGAYTGANHRSVKQSNRATIFRAIRALGPIARVDLARRTGLNPGTVTNIVDELVAAGLAGETGFGASRVGRKPVYLEVNPAARLAIGIDLARSTLTGAVVDLAGRQRERVVEPGGGPWQDESVLDAVGRVTERLLASLSPAERATVVGIGIGAPGPLSIRSGRFLAPPSFGTWRALDLRPQIERRVGLPTFVDNNGNTSALAELWYGAGQGVDDFVLLTLGTGVGAGLVLDGDLYRGDHDLAGEIGHVSINLDGPRCACGNYGCLELYASVPRVLAAVQAALATGEPSILRAETDDDVPPTIEAVIAALQAGDALASRVFADVARHLASGLVNVIYTLDPQLILLGRTLAGAGDALLDPVRAEVRRRVFPALRDAVRIEIAALPDAPVIGAATLALREFFHAPLTSGVGTGEGGRAASVSLAITPPRSRAG